MTKPLMPKATALWLIDNTMLSFKQIADFCDMHHIEIEAMADGDVAKSVKPLSPMNSGMLTAEDIKEAEADHAVKLVMRSEASGYINTQTKPKTKYTPIVRRQDKPDAIAWLLKKYPNISDKQIIKLIGTTKNTIDSIKNKTHRNQHNIKAKDPVLLGLCAQTELHKIVQVLEQDKEAANNL